MRHRGRKNQRGWGDGPGDYSKGGRLHKYRDRSEAQAPSHKRQEEFKALEIVDEAILISEKGVGV